jgi:glycosyltransferase involved in cell wall biosynthesis
MVGNYRPQKNQLFAVSVLAKLPEEYTIDIYGMIDDKLYYESLQNHIQTLQLEHRVNLVKGVSNIYEKISEYGLALHTSLAETLLVLVEYLYAQIPFITYETGDVVSVIKNQLPNFIVPTFDEQDWLIAIEKMQQLNNFEETKSLMTTIINQHFSEEAYYTQLLNIYQQLV